MIGENIVWGNLWSSSGKFKMNIVLVGLGIYALSGLAHMATTKGFISTSQSKAYIQQQEAAGESGWNKFFKPVQWAVSALSD
ncbi:MAG: hypothetical protein WD989_00060 [Candidatus Paceibacterota bacterium]